MLHHVLAPDIEDNGHLWLQRDDVRKILVRTYAQINAARLCLLQVLQYVLERHLIRHEIVGTKVSASFGKLRDYVPKCFVAELFRKFVDCNKRMRRETQRTEKRDKRRRG